MHQINHLIGHSVLYLDCLDFQARCSSFLGVIHLDCLDCVCNLVRCDQDW